MPQIVTAMVPLANMFGYINTLRSMSRAARNIRWSSIITRKCRKRSRTKSRPNTPDE